MKCHAQKRAHRVVLVALSTALGVVSSARANGIVNGDFEAGGAGWSAHPPAPAIGDRPVIVAGLGLPAPGPGNMHLGWIGTRGAGAPSPSALLQTYDCQPPIPPQNPHCTVTFDAQLHLAANEIAVIILKNAAGNTSIGSVPAGGPATYSMSVPGCMPTVVAFAVADVAGGVVDSIFRVDNVLCACVEGSQSQLQEPSYPFPWEPPGPDDAPGQPPQIEETLPDCNGNGVPDLLEVADGLAPDANNNGIPDLCECPADRDGNGTVDVDDLILVLLAIGANDPIGDVDGSGTVDIDDLIEILLAWGPCRPAPMVWGHAPDVFANGTVFTLFGDGFSLDPADTQVVLLTEDDLPIPTQVLLIHDVDGDGDGEALEALVDGLLQSDDGQPLRPLLRSAQGDSFALPDDPAAQLLAAPDGDDVEDPDDGQGAQSQPTPAQLTGRLYGEWVGGATRRYRFSFAEGLNWLPSSTYRLDIRFTVKFQVGGGAVKTQRYTLTNTTMTTDATPTLAECLDAMVAKMNAMLNTTATPGERTTIFNTFEWVRNGNQIELRKKAGAPGGTNLVDFGAGRNRPTIVYRRLGG